MAAAPQLGVASYKPDVNQVQPRGISMMVSGDTGVPYGTMMPQLATLQIGNSVSGNFNSCLNHLSHTHTHIHTKTLFPSPSSFLPLLLVLVYICKI